MKPLFVALLAFLSLGFTIDAPETPEQKAAREKQESAWRTVLVARFELKSLRDFLVAQIKAQPSYEDANLEKSAVAPTWNIAGTGVNCGDWHFSIADPNQDEFHLEWVYEVTRQKDGTLLQKTIVLECKRIDSKTFRLINISRQVDELVELNA